MNCMKKYLNAISCTIGFLLAALVAGCSGGDHQDAILNAAVIGLVSVAVTPANTSLPRNAPQRFLATATYSGGASRDVTALSAWTSATTSVASIDGASGLATSISPGTSVITAGFGGKAGSTTLTVTAATLVSLAMAPLASSVASAQSRQFSVTGTFTDGSTRDVTALSSFSSGTPATATIVTGSGLATGVTAGTSLITASFGAMSVSTTLTVTPATLVSVALAPVSSTLLIGATRQFAVTATYSDDTSADVSASSVYGSSTEAVATIDAASGLATGIAAGASTITATFGGIVATSLISVPAATLVSIAVSPPSPTMLAGDTQPFTATGTYSDGTTANITDTVNWTSGNVTVATILSTGVATALAPGAAVISAAQGSPSGSAVLTVSGIALDGAETFAVLAGTSITNNAGGTTIVTGDVGAPVQTVDPVQTMGSANYKSGATLAEAMAGLQQALTDAESRTCDVSSPAGIDLGGLILPPGVYCYADSINLTGTLALNGAGLYIFRTASTLNTTANSIVALTGGATAASVYFVPVGPTTLGANSVFKGTVMSANAAITVGDNTTLLQGRVLTGAAVTLRNNQITRP